MDPVSGAALDLLKTGSPWAIVVLLGLAVLRLWSKDQNTQADRLREAKADSRELVTVIEGDSRTNAGVAQALESLNRSNDARLEALKDQHRSIEVLIRTVETLIRAIETDSGRLHARIDDIRRALDAPAAGGRP